MRRLALLGASGHGKVVADLAKLVGWQSVQFFDDAWPCFSGNGHWPVVGDTAALLGQLGQFDGVLVTIGQCATRWQKQEALRTAGARIVSLVHPRACVSGLAKVGNGSVVMAGAVINVDALLGEACIINTGATVDHDCQLAHAVHISPGAHLSGDVRVGACSWVGVGAAVRQGVRIGANVLVGAGAVVVKPVGDGLTVTGCPARAVVTQFI
jgi:sugar O-acyltransferase (sialic acid O-acetyltransferase NeuD family)